MEKVSCYTIFPLYIKMSEITYYERNRDVVLHIAKKYYEKNKDVLRKQARNKRRELTEEEEKYTKRKYGRNIS